jgi:hypothetical protein
MTGIAKAEWSSSQYELISFGFPVRNLRWYNSFITTYFIVNIGSPLSWPAHPWAVSSRLRQFGWRDLGMSCMAFCPSTTAHRLAVDWKATDYRGVRVPRHQLRARM